MTNPDIAFSVIVPLYNKEKSIYSTIFSILDQNYPFFELIIVNDGSADGSLAVAESFNDERIRIFNQVNKGVSAARNAGIVNSRYQYVTFLDADDLWLPECLSEFKKLIENFPQAAIYCSNYNMSGKNLTGSDNFILVEDFYLFSARYYAKWSIPLIITGCVAVRKSLFNMSGLFNESITHGEDTDMWERLAELSSIAKSDKITTIYRTESENRASVINDSEKYFGGREKINRKKVKTRSQKQYYGIQILFTMVSNLFVSRDIGCLKNIFKYPDWIIHGCWLILKYRILRQDIFNK